MSHWNALSSQRASGGALQKVAFVFSSRRRLNLFLGSMNVLCTAKYTLKGNQRI